MSWLFSQALVEEFLPGSFSDGEPSAQWNVMPTPQGFWRNDKMMEFSRLSQFGPTLRLLTEDLGEAVLMSYLAVFPARTYRLLEPVKESMESGAGCGKKCGEWFARWDQDSSLWKTAQRSLVEDLELYSETWPRSGSIVNGYAYQRPSVVLPTSETESGFWPTPTVCGNYNRKGASKTSGDGLATAVKNWPTPTASASASKGSSPASLTRKSGADRSNDRLDHAVMASDGGQLNPPWVEWLMGWPIGWTELKPSGTDKSQSVQQQHFKN